MRSETERGNCATPPRKLRSDFWQALRGRQLEGFRFRRQVAVGAYIVDFLCPQAKLIVEIDGGQHMERGAYDHERTDWLSRRGYGVLRYWNHQVLQQLDDVVADIHRALTKGFTPPQPSPSPAAKGRG